MTTFNDGPDFRRLEVALRCGEPDRVPLVELRVEPEVKSAFLGRPFPGGAADPRAFVEAEIEFSVAAGYDYLRLPPTLPYPELFTTVESQYGVYGGQRQRGWAAQHEGAIATRDDFDRYPFPSPDQADFTLHDLAAEAMPPTMRIVTGVKGGGIFERVWQLMGFERMCFATVEEPGLVAALFERIGSIYYETCRLALDRPRVGAVWYADDLAYTEGLLMSPDFYRRHCFPWYRRIADLCRERGLPVLLHSDGVLWEIMDDVLDIGFHALHPIEPKAMDIVEVKRRTAGRLCVIGNIDLGYTLTRGSPEEVDAEVKERIRTVGPGGGYCLGSSNTVTEYVPIANYRAMIDAARRYGRYPIELL
jgi:uroporphyrinogen decarboxylase